VAAVFQPDDVVDGALGDVARAVEDVTPFDEVAVGVVVPEAGGDATLVLATPSLWDIA
jgi:hypothetical protein